MDQVETTLHHLRKETIFRYYNEIYVITEEASKNEGDIIRAKCIARYGDAGMISLGGMYLVENSREEDFNAYGKIKLIDKMWTVVP